MIRHLAGLAEIVDDLPAAVAFYRDTLGLDVQHDEESNYAVVTMPGVLHLGLWPREQAAEMILGDSARAAEIPLGFSVEFEADNLDTANSALRSSGAAIYGEPEEMPWGQRVMHLRSFTGAVIGLSELPERRRLTQDVEAGPEA